MALFRKKKSSSCSAACMTLKWVVNILLILAAVAALIGVYYTHVITGDETERLALQFGTTGGSLAILAFTVAVVSWSKQLVACLGPCEICDA